MKIFGSIQELVELVYRKGSNTVTLKPNIAQAANVVVSLPNLSADDTVVTQAASQSLSNKTSIQVDNLTLDGDTITGINNIQLQPGASGSVLISRPLRLVSSSSIILQDLDNSHSITISAPAAVTVNRTPEIPDDTGNFVLTSAGQSLTNKIISGAANTLSNISLTSSVTGVLPAANGGTGVNSTATFPSSGTVAVLTDISASQLSGIVPGSKGGTGVNNAGTLTYGTNNITLTTSAATNLTLPTSGTLVTEDSSNILLNKQISSTAAITGALTLPSGSEGQRPGSPVDGMVRYNTDSGSFEGRANGNWSGIGGGGTTDLISTSPALHGLQVGDVVYLNGSTYTKAIASAANTAEVVGVVSRVISTTQFEITLSGEISGLEAADFEENALPAVGEVLFLSGTTAGKLTITEPSTIGYVSIPVGVVSEQVPAVSPTSVKMYVAIKRGVIIGGSNARTNISLANAPTVNTVQNVAAYDAGELTGWVSITATTPLRFYVAAQFSKNGAGNNYNISYQTSGDAPPAGFLVSITSAGLIQIQLATSAISGFASATINYALNAPAVGTTFPLSVSARNVLGDTTGTAVPAGYVGESINQTSTSSTIPASQNRANVATIANLPAGVWAITGGATIDPGGTLNVSNWNLSISSTSLASGELVTSPAIPVAGAFTTHGVIGPVIVNISTATTFYLTIGVAWTGSGGVFANQRLKAVRIA